MRKRRETQKGSLSSAQATGDNMSQENNVAEQKLHEVQNLLNGVDLDDVASIGITIVLSAIKQKANLNANIAMKLFEAAIDAMGETFFRVTMPSIIVENLKRIVHE